MITTQLFFVFEIKVKDECNDDSLNTKPIDFDRFREQRYGLLHEESNKL